MSHVGRTLRILLAALIVVAAAIGFSYTSFAGDLVPAAPSSIPSDPPPGLDDTAGDAASAAAQTERPARPAGEGRPEGGHAGGWFSVVEIVKNLALMGLMVGLVTLIPQGRQRIRRPKRRPRPESPASPPGA